MTSTATVCLESNGHFERVTTVSGVMRMQHWHAAITYCEETSNVIRNHSSDRFNFHAYRCDSELAAQPLMGLWSQWRSWNRRGNPDRSLVDGQAIS